MPSVAELIAALENPDARTRLDAARRLRETKPPPVEAVAALVARLDDEGSVSEDWTDWAGSVVGGTTHYVADFALDALVPIGTPAFIAVVAAIEAGGPARMLCRLLAALPMDAICAAGRDVVTRAMQLQLASASPPVRDDDPVLSGPKALAWANDELSRSEDRVTVLGRRVHFSVGPTAQLAAMELGTVAAGAARCAATFLAELLLREKLPNVFVQSAAAASLGALGPVLDAPLASRLVAIAPTKAMFHCWPELLPAVAAYPDAAQMAPWLFAWVRDDEPPMQIGKEHHAKVRIAAAAALRKLGDGARPPYDELAEIYAAGPKERRSLVLRALPDRSVLVSRLGARWRNVLAGGDRRAIEDVLDAIEGVGAAAAPLLDALMPFVEGRQSHYLAVLAIGQLGEAARPAVPALIRALDDPKLRTWACYSLRDLGPVAVAAIGPLEKLAAQERAARELNPTAQRALTRVRGG